MIRFFYSPDLGVSVGGELVATTKKKKTKGYTPNSDDDFSVIADRVNVAWEQNTKIILLWITQTEYGDLCLSFSEELEQRKSVGGDRPSFTSLLRQQMGSMDTAVTEVKIYIEKKYKKAFAKPQFPRFGITKENGAYMLPRDHNKRLKALDLMIAAIAKDGFADEEYGTQFWVNMKAGFLKALTEASQTDGTVSNKVSAKNVTRMQMEKAMKALRTVLMGNYPDTYKAVFREWGWQK